MIGWGIISKIQHGGSIEIEQMSRHSWNPGQLLPGHRKLIPGHLTRVNFIKTNFVKPETWIQKNLKLNRSEDLETIGQKETKKSILVDDN